MRLRRSILRMTAGLVLLLALAFFLLPWKLWLGDKLIAILQQKGVQSVALTVDHVGLRGITLRDLSVGEQAPLRLGQITVDYRLREVTLRGLSLEAQQSETGWALSGLDALSAASPSAAPMAIPVTPEALAAMPFRRASLEGRLHVAGKAFTADVPLAFEWLKGDEIAVMFAGDATAGKFGEATFTIGKLFWGVKLDAANAQWAGRWSIDPITIASSAVALPPLVCSGDTTAQAQRVRVTGNCASADKTFLLDAALDYRLDAPQQSTLTITRAQMPWSGGKLAVRDVVVPLGAKKAITIALRIDQVDIAALMQTLLGDRVKATGVVSGVVPITIGADGSLRFKDAALKAQQPGIIALAPETIPGDNAQVALVRELLKNLHYNLLSLELNSGDDRKLGVTLAVEGVNPDVEQGRPIKLKVHLSGDVLDLVKQNLLLMTDPKQFIQQGHDENH
ncbi:MAG: YdbH domain-containing protein [Pseudomonadota bacterium]